MGFIVLLPMLFILALGFGLTTVLAAIAQTRERHSGYTIGWIVAGTISTIATAFSFSMFFFGGFGSDADTGALDFYKTPLGGGFYVYSIDSSYELPLPLAHRNDGEHLVQSERNTVSALACLDGQTFLKFKRDYGRIDLQKRTLVRLTERELPAAAQRSSFWTNKQGFSRTPCADVQVSTQDAVRNTLAFIIGPLVAVVSLILLLNWGRRIPTVPPQTSERSADW